MIFIHRNWKCSIQNPLRSLSAGLLSTFHALSTRFLSPRVPVAYFFSFLILPSFIQHARIKIPVCLARTFSPCWIIYGHISAPHLLTKTSAFISNPEWENPDALFFFLNSRWYDPLSGERLMESRWWEAFWELPRGRTVNIFSVWGQQGE